MNEEKTEMTTETAHVFRVGKKVVAALNEAGDVVKAVRGSKHFLRKPPAICFDEAVIHEAIRMGATGLLVYDVETGVTYRSTMDAFLADSFEFNRGWGIQLAMRLGKWNTGEDSTHDGSEQPSLFNEGESGSE